MRITGISAQIKNPNRVSISVDGKYRFSLDVFQLVEYSVKIGNEYSEKELTELETESQFGKLYGRVLEYTMLRPHSKREINNYLWRKTRATKYRSRNGDIKEREGVSETIAGRVLDRLEEKGYIDDEKFARYWVENRNQVKGSSIRKLTSELQAKGVERTIIERVVQESERSDIHELRKVIEKKRRRYDSDEKLMQYLTRQGFRYDDIKTALIESE